MSFEALHYQELPWISALQSLRGPWLDKFFISLNIFDQAEFYFILIPLLWYLVSPRWGLRLFYLTLFNSLLNGFFKQLFQQPRPFDLLPEINLLTFANYGFPSGAAQTAVLLPFLLIKEWKSPFAWILGALFFFFVSLSRIYLGAHFPSDLLGGWLIGFFIAYSFYKFGPSIEQWVTTNDKSHVLLTSLAIFTLFIVLTPTSAIMRSAYCALGGSFGLYLAKDLKDPWHYAKTLAGRLLQIILTILALFSLPFIGIILLAERFPAHQLAFKSLTFFTLGFAATLGIPYLFTIILKKKDIKC